MDAQNDDYAQNIVITRDTRFGVETDDGRIVYYNKYTRVEWIIATLKDPSVSVCNLIVNREPVTIPKILLLNAIGENEDEKKTKTKTRTKT